MIDKKILSNFVKFNFIFFKFLEIDKEKEEKKSFFAKFVKFNFFPLFNFIELKKKKVFRGFSQRGRIET